MPIVQFAKRRNIWVTIRSYFGKECNSEAIGGVSATWAPRLTIIEAAYRTVAGGCAAALDANALGLVLVPRKPG